MTPPALKPADTIQASPPSSFDRLAAWPSTLRPSLLRHSEIGEFGRPVPKQGYPSGQRGWDEVPVRSASQVRILSSAPLSNRHLGVFQNIFDIGGLALRTPFKL